VQQTNSEALLISALLQ